MPVSNVASDGLALFTPHMYLPEVGHCNCICYACVVYYAQIIIKRYSKCEELCVSSMPQSKILGLGIKATLTVQPIVHISVSAPSVA